MSDALTMTARCLRLTSRQLDALLTSLLLPVMLMLMFVYLFGGAIHTGTSYVTYVVPGVLLLCAGFGAATTAVNVSQDMAGGVIDRFRSLDVRGAAFLTGHVVASVARNVVSTALVFSVAFLVGFRPHAGAGGLARRGGHPAGVRPGHLLARGRVRAAGQDRRGRQRLHVHHGVPALREQPPSCRSPPCRGGSRASRATSRSPRSWTACAGCSWARRSAPPRGRR